MPTKAVSLNVDKSGSFAAQTVRISQADKDYASAIKAAVTQEGAA